MLLNHLNLNSPPLQPSNLDTDTKPTAENKEEPSPQVPDPIVNNDHNHASDDDDDDDADDTEIVTLDSTDKPSAFEKLQGNFGSLSGIVFYLFTCQVGWGRREGFQYVGIRVVYCRDGEWMMLAHKGLS